MPSRIPQAVLVPIIGLSLVIAAWWIFVGEPTANAGQAGAGGAVVVEVLDGDTMVVVLDGHEQHVRLIGIDTPEREECGYEEATDALAALVESRAVSLVSGAQSDTDVYGRLLRYVEIDGKDVGLELITQGLAVARYDSRTDQPHPREKDYWAADAAAPQQMCMP